jgi:predicted RNA-binding protein YlqC (UPF0109 family)
MQQHFQAHAVLGQEVDVVYTQKQYMGRIIGKKGVKINDLQDVPVVMSKSIKM